MMKNSKLSKLLVAGVSVAVLASAVAPMAFAEGEGSETEAAPEFTVIFGVDTTKAEFDEADATLNGRYGDWATGNNKETLTKNLKLKDSVSLPNLTLKPYVKETYQAYLDLNGNGIFDADANEYEIKGNESVEKIQTLIDSEDPDEVVFASINFKFEEKDHYELVNVVVENPEASDAWSKAYTTDWGSFDEDKWSSDKVSATFTPDVTSIALPKFQAKSGWELDHWEVKVTGKTGVNTLAQKDLANGAVLDLTTYSSLFKDKGISPDWSVGTVTVKPKFTKTSKTYNLELTDLTSVSGGKYTVEVRDGSSSVILQGVQASNVEQSETLSKYTTAGVAAPAEVDLPVLTTTTKGWTFSHWEVEDESTILLSKKDSKDQYISAKGYVISGDAFTLADFAPDSAYEAGAKTIQLVPVFMKGETPDPVVEYRNVKTPNDTEESNTKLEKYVDGKKVSMPTRSTTVGADMKFEKGLFTNQVTGTVAYYKPLNSLGKWEIDTSVNGLVDGIVFDKGVQDTEAYGLYKVSDSDPFFYLVSDGVYQADYNGMWEDEDGSVYKLEKGCTNTTFTGVYDRGDWALSVKDSKVQKDETGFVLYGDTQYWFINGICNMKETEAVRQHTNGHFYYTVGAKIDFTFNGTVNGHTFVNGEAAE